MQTGNGAAGAFASRVEHFARRKLRRVPKETSPIVSIGPRRGACLDSIMEAEESRSRNRRIFLLLFLLLNFLYLITSSGRVRTIDEVTVDYQAESLVTRGSTAVPQAVQAGTYFGKADAAGNPQAPYGVGQALLVAPWYVLGRLLRAVAPGIPPQARDLALDTVLTSSSATFSALAAALVFLLLVRQGIHERPALAAAFLVALATPLFAYSSWFFSEPLAAVLLLGAAFSLFSEDAATPPSWRRAAWGGLLLGIALWVRPAHAVAISVFLLGLLVRHRRRSLLPIAGVTLIAGLLAAACLWRNEILFGNAFDFGYPSTAEAGRPLLTFENPLTTGLFGFLFSPGKSVFLFAPPVLMALPGVIYLWRRDRGLAVVAGLTPVAYLLFYSRYTLWEGGYCFGPRYLVPAIPLLCLGAGALLQEAGAKTRRLALVLGLFGFLVQIVCMSTSFLEDQAGGAYYDEHWHYRMSYAPLVSQSARLIHYLFSADPAPLGRGFDRWFVFLAKGGVSHTTIGVALFLQVFGFLLAAWRLSRALSRQQEQ